MWKYKISFPITWAKILVTEVNIGHSFYPALDRERIIAQKPASAGLSLYSCRDGQY